MNATEYQREMLKKRNAVGVAVAYSRDDGGWYADVCDVFGKDLHQTEIHASEVDAWEAAVLWAEKNTPEGVTAMRING